MDFNFIGEVLPIYFKAAILTLRIGLTGTILSFLTGLFCALINYWKIPVLKKIVAVYIEFSRNTPLLIQLFFLYFALPKIGIKLSGEASALIGLTFLGGSYMAESIRSALESVGNAQIEGAACLGLKKGQILFYVIFPQALLFSLPGILANVIFLLKETSIFSAVAVVDLMFVAKDLIGLYYKTEEALFLLVIAYFIILLPFSLTAYFVEKRLGNGKL